MNDIGTDSEYLFLPDEDGLYDCIQNACDREPGRAVLSRNGPAGTVDVDYLEFVRDVDTVASAMLRRGVGHGDRAIVLGTTSYEWVVADFALLGIGAVTVPIFPTASAHQIQHIVTDCDARWFVAQTAEDAERLRAAGADEVWLFGEFAGWDATVHEDLAGRRRAVRAADLATIVYTSGTTGAPKGCMLTHRNMYASSANTVLQTDWLFRRSGPEPGAGPAVTVLALPLSHVFGRTILLSCLLAGTKTRLVAGVPEMLPVLPEARPTFLALVPYALEKIRKWARRVLEDGAEEAAVAAGSGHGVDGAPLPELARFRDLLGGRLSDVICGGASLDATSWDFYAGVGVRILNCYGLTEAATAVTVNTPETNRRDTVGRAIPGTTVAIADDGEVLVSGDNVSAGYWPQALAPDGSVAAVDGRWLRTGDLGELDSDGHLRITGRRKEILVTSGGKNVAPTPLEDRIRLHRLVENCMVVGEGRPYVTALITMDEDVLREWVRSNGDPADPVEVRSDPALLAELGKAVDEANSLVSRAESIRRFRVVSGAFTTAAGLLTPSMKLRRAEIEKAYADDIEALYKAV